MDSPVASPVNSVELTPLDVNEVIAYIKKKVMEHISQIPEIQETRPELDFTLATDENGVTTLVVSASFPHDVEDLDPMQYANRLLVADMIKTIVMNKMNTH